MASRNLPYSFDVDASFYYAQYQDVASSGQPAAQHYHLFGWHEERNPDSYFDTLGYLTTYQDVNSAGIDPLGHFHTYGWHEGRTPSPAFDPQAYLAANPDVAAAGIDPLAHYLRYGQYEGRQAIAKPLYDADGTANGVSEHAGSGTGTGVTFSWGGFISPNLHYTLAGDTSGGGFAVDANTGRVYVADGSKIDYDASGPSHSYVVTVTASDLGHTITQSAVIAVGNTGANAPVFTSGTTASEPENTPASTVVYTAHATDPDGNPVTYALGGTDAALFHIDTGTGAVTFLTSPDHEHPTDANQDNVYDIVVTATDGSNPHHTASLGVAITVQNVDDSVQANPDNYTFVADLAPPPSSNVLYNDINTGTPGLSVDILETMTYQGDYGVLTLNPDGTFTYVPHDTIEFAGRSSVQDTFTYTAINKDGDRSESALTLTIVNEPAASTLAVSKFHAIAPSTDGHTLAEAPEQSIVAADTAGPAPLHLDPVAESDTVAIIKLPGNGTLTLADGGAAVHQGDTLSAGQFAGLSFKPEALDDDAHDTFQFTVTHGSTQTLSTVAVDTLHGSGLTFVGTTQNDQLIGGAGADTFHGGGGHDVVTGGGGADHFVFDSASQTMRITDYHAGNVIDVGALNAPFGAAAFQARENAAGTGASLQVNTGSESAPHWAEVAQLDGLHVGDDVALSADAAHPAAVSHIHVEAHGLA